MDTVTVYLRHSWILRSFGRNPLVRVSDRAEALVIVLAFTTVLVITPFAGAITTAVHQSRAHQYSEEARTRHPVAATVTADPTSTIQKDKVIITAPVRWRVDGRERAGKLEVSSGTKAGDQLQIWVDGDGDQLGEPPSPWRAGTDALGAGAVFWLGTVAGVAGLTALVRARLARQRDAAWEREWKLLTNDGGGRTGSQA